MRLLLATTVAVQATATAALVMYSASWPPALTWTCLAVVSTAAGLAVRQIVRHV